MPIPFDPDVEAKLQAMLSRMRSNHEAKHGPGAFEQSVRKGRILLTKRADELTPEKRAILDVPPPAKQS